MRFAGEGSELWRARVDLIAPDDSAHRVPASWVAMERLLGSDDGTRLAGIGAEHGVDQGTGIAKRPVIGFTFWVRAGDVGQAAITAVDTARRAGRGVGVGPQLYDVTVIPASMVALPYGQHFPDMPD